MLGVSIIWLLLLLLSAEEKLEKGKVIKELDVLPRAWKVSIEIKPSSKVKGHTSIFRGTIGGNYKQHGDRIPAIFFKTSSNKLIICSSINDNANYCDPKDLPGIPLNEWTKIVVQQIQKDDIKYHYEIFINGTNEHSIVNEKPRSFKNVKYYASDPIRKPADAMIKNVVIELYTTTTTTTPTTSTKTITTTATATTTTTSTNTTTTTPTKTITIITTATTPTTTTTTPNTNTTLTSTIKAPTTRISTTPTKDGHTNTTTIIIIIVVVIVFVLIFIIIFIVIVYKKKRTRKRKKKKTGEREFNLTELS